MVDKETIAKLQKTLEDKRGNLEKELSRFATKDKDLEHDWDSKYPRTKDGDMEDAADEVEEYSTSRSIEFNLEKQLKSVNLALNKIKKGKYGACETCNKPIEKEKLLAFPETLQCLSCQGDA